MLLVLNLCMSNSLCQIVCMFLFQPKDSVLLQVTLVRVKIEDIDGTQFAEDVARLVKELGFNDVEVSLYALLGDEDGNTV